MDPGWLVTGALVSARVAGIFLTLPVLGMMGIPTPVRVLMSMAVTLIIAPAVPPCVEPLTVSAMTVGIISEVVIGVLMGGVVRMVFGALSLGGELIGSQTGHAAALQFDPTLQLSQGPLGALVTFLASAVFVGLDMHLQVLVALADSFYVVPPGARVDLLHASIVWVELAGVVIKTGARIAAPAVVLVFAINLFVASITRLSPQMNIFFSLGMLLTLWAGMIIYFAGMPLILHFHIGEVRASMDLIPEILERLVR